MNPTVGTTHIVILGGGFAGVYTARQLEKRWRHNPAVQVTLISKNNYFLMTPLLFEAGSGVLEPRHAVSPLRRLFDRTRLIEATVESIDFDTRRVEARLMHDQRIAVQYDHLVLALGGVTHTALVPGAENAMTFKTLSDAITLRNHCIQAFEEADVEKDPVRRQQLLTFIIVGGGLVGVELQGELTEFILNIAHLYPNVQREEIRFVLIESGPRLMPELEEDLAEYASRTLQRHGVQVRLNASAANIEAERVVLKSGETLEAGTIVFAAGVTPNPLLKDLKIEKCKKGRAIVEATMRNKSYPSVWALGDCAAIPDPTGKPYPMLAQHAIREGRRLAENITAVIRGKEPQPFVYHSKGTLASLGHFRGVGTVYKLKLYGFVAWWVWRTYYLMQMPRWERRFRIILDWTVALMFKNDVVQLDMTKDR